MRGSQKGAQGAKVADTGAPTVLILMYHAVIPTRLAVPHSCFLERGSFERRLRYVQSRFEIVALEEALERLQADRRRARLAVLTFDDGYQNHHDIVLPILEQARCPATFFPVSGFVGTEDTLWFCRVHRAIALTRKDSVVWDGAVHGLASGAECARATHRIQEALKVLPQPQLLERVGELSRVLGVDPEEPIAANSHHRMLSLEALQRLAESPWVTLGAHSHSHAVLSLLNTADQAQEIDRSIEFLERTTASRCNLFSYPNGRAVDYNAVTLQHLAARGVYAAVTTEPGLCRPTTPPLELRREAHEPWVPGWLFRWKIRRLTTRRPGDVPAGRGT